MSKVPETPEISTEMQPAAPVGHTSMTDTLEKLTGRKLTRQEITLLEERIKKGFSEEEDSIQSIGAIVELMQSWKMQSHGPSIKEIVERLETGFRNFLPTGDSAIDAALTTVIGQLSTLKYKTQYSVADWDILRDLIREGRSIMSFNVKDSSKAKVLQEAREKACAEFKQAADTFDQSVKG